MSAIRNSGVSVFEGVVKCPINGMFCSDYALSLHYSVSPGSTESHSSAHSIHVFSLFISKDIVYHWHLCVYPQLSPGLM